MSKIKRIAFLGGPGVGRSTLAAKVFAQLKEHHLPVELIDEEAKLYAWQKYQFKGHEGFKLMVDQICKEEAVMLNGGIVVTTASPFMNLVYSSLSKQHYCPEILETAKKYEKMYPALNFLVQRTVPYQELGRYQTKEEAGIVDTEVLNVLLGNNVDFIWAFPEVNKEQLVHTIEFQLNRA